MIRIAYQFLLTASVSLASCSAPTDTLSLVRQGNQKACATVEVRQILRNNLTEFLTYRKQALKSDKGEDISKVRYAFNPITSIGSDKGQVECVASAYLSKDESKPWVDNTLEVRYVLGENLMKEELSIRGNFDSLYEESRFLYDNAGLLAEIKSKKFPTGISSCEDVTAGNMAACAAAAAELED
jgi:hypothetical protein